MSYAHLKALAERAGSHFFDRDTMRFFNSRVLESSVTPVWNAELGRPDHNLGYWFVTSEQHEYFSYEHGPVSEPRLYSIRRGVLVNYKREGDGRECQRFEVDTVGEFQQYETGPKAKRAMRKLIEEEKTADN